MSGKLHSRNEAIKIANLILANKASMPDVDTVMVCQELLALQRGMELGLCGHLRMFIEDSTEQLIGQPEAFKYVSNNNAYCTLCADIAAAYERGKRDVMEYTRGYTTKEMREEILALQDKGPKGGRE